MHILNLLLVPIFFRLPILETEYKSINVKVFDESRSNRMLQDGHNQAVQIQISM